MMNIDKPNGPYRESDQDRREIQRLLDAYGHYFTPTPLENDETPFEMVTFFNMEEQVFVSDSTEDIGED